MTDEPNSMLVHCGWCRHEWFAFKLPMPITEAAELAANMRCPECDKALIYCGPAPPQDVFKKREKVNMSDDLVKRLRSLGSAGPGRISFLASEDAMKAADRIEKLESANLAQSCIKVDDQMRIEKLEAVIKDDTLWLAAYHLWCAMKGFAPSSSDLIAARKTLEGKDD